jgi:hypothetical protein
MLRANRHLFASKKAYKTFSGYAKGQLDRMEKLTAEVLEKIDKHRELLVIEGVTFEPKSGSPVMPPGLNERQVAAVKKYEELRKKYFGGFMGDKRRNLVKKVGYDSKNASHLIRLLRMSVEFLKTGDFIVNRTGVDAEELLDIKHGKWQLETVKLLAAELFEEARVAHENSELPEEPDKDTVEQLMMQMILGRLSDYV